MSDKNKWRVVIIEYATDKVEKTIECINDRSADKVDAGLQINLNHEKFYTLIKKPGES